MCLQSRGWVAILLAALATVLRQLFPKIWVPLSVGYKFCLVPVSMFVAIRTLYRNGNGLVMCVISAGITVVLHVGTYNVITINGR